MILSDWQRFDQDHGAFTLDQVGTYSIIIRSTDDGVGAYQFTIWDVPEPETFEARIGPADADENRRIYSGTIEIPGEIHNYEFEVDAGQTIFVDGQGSNGSQLSWLLEDADGNVVVEDARADRDNQYTFETAGTYTLVILGRGDGVGDYAFQLWDVPEAETFGAEIGSSNPEENEAIFTGTINSPGTIHVYEFTAEAEQTVFIVEDDSNGSQLSWILENSSGQVLIEEQRADQNIQFFSETTDTYTLTVFGRGDGMGDYAFQIWDVPDFEIFEYTLGEIITGEIITPGQAVGYTFEASGGDVLYFEALGGSGFAVRWFFETVDGVPLTDVTRIDADIGEFVIQEDGEYKLVFFGNDEGVGEYSARVWNTSIEPDDLTVDLGEVIIGNIDAGEEIAFTFLLEDEMNLYFSAGGEVGGDITWQLQDDDWNFIFEPRRLWIGNDVGELTLQPGGYTITVKGETAEDSGLYQFAVWDADATDLIEYEIGQLVDATNTGEISQAGEVDRYMFTLEEDGNVIFMGLLTEEGSGFNWSLFDERDNQIFQDAGLWYNNEIGPLTLTAGNYTLEVVGSGADTGMYSFQTWFITPPDYNEIGIGAIIQDGEPREGAGNVEVPGAQDSYLLILNEPAEVTFVALGYSEDSGVVWTVFDLDDNPLFVEEGLWQGNDLGPFNLEAGAYNIIVTGVVNLTGTYGFEIREE